MLGYFAFPPRQLEAPDNSRTPLSFTENVQRDSAPTPTANATNPQKERENNAHLKEQRAIAEEKRKARLERERQEAYLSELAWVRSGGVLRDFRGRRDKVRTEQLRQEIRLQDEERRITERWALYETQLRALQSPQSTGPVTWDMIPWPLVFTPSSPTDFDALAVADFIFSTFRVRGVNAMRKERLKSSILRWHPDKFATVFARVVEDDYSRVVDGVNAVFRSLRQIQEEEKAEHA